jgi:5' nucleotidase, deoxy (Pyrimidine), cytosolic type C protein (NT5C)
MRIAFDMDGVLADMQAAVNAVGRKLGADSQPSDPTEAADVSPSSLDGERGDDAAGRVSQDWARRVFQEISRVENFWDSLEEIEPGSVAALARQAAERRWEVIFLTKRPPTAGDTAQVQTQRWLQRHGFPIPSVFVVTGSRGHIASALALDVVVDDTPENCLDVVLESQAKAILVWRGHAELPAKARKMGVGVVSSLTECLDVLARAESEGKNRGFMNGLRKLLGLGKT